MIIKDFQFDCSLIHVLQENLAPAHQPSPKPRSYSLSHDKVAPAILASAALQSSSSETRLQELQQTMASMPVMRSIVSWLKSLRLHKYRWKGSFIYF